MLSAAPLVRVAMEPIKVPLTDALALPVVPPLAVSVCAPCAPMLPPVVIVTVTVQVPPPAAAVQLEGDTPYTPLSPLIVSVAAWFPLLVKVTAPVAAVPP